MSRVGAQLSAEGRHGFDFREDAMRVPEFWMPNHALQATPVDVSLEVLRHRSGVPELLRWVKYP